MNPVIEYEQASKLTTALAKGLEDIWKRCGRPHDASTNSGWIVIDNIVSIWVKYFPQEVADWKYDRAHDLQDEITLQQLLKKDGGYNPITYPPTLYLLLHTLLDKQKLNDKDFMRKLAKAHPLFLTTNLKI